MKPLHLDCFVISTYCMTRFFVIYIWKFLSSLTNTFLFLLGVKHNHLSLDKEFSVAAYMFQCFHIRVKFLNTFAINQIIFKNLSNRWHCFQCLVWKNCFSGAEIVCIDFNASCIHREGENLLICVSFLTIDFILK